MPVPHPVLSRRRLLQGAGAVSAAGLLSACGRAAVPAAAIIGPADPSVAAAEQARRVAGGRVVEATLTARPSRVDLGGLVVDTWAYDDAVPGRLLRARAGDTLRVVVRNQLPAPTTVHWHGIALRNDMDGVPGVTQDPIAAGASMTYEFVVPDPGTHWFHPHVGVQLDRGLYAPLIVDDPAEPGRYDAEWVVVLDDWVDGTGRTPDDVLRELAAGAPGTGGMDMGSMAGENQGGDVTYPHYLANGRIPTAPVTLTGKPGQRVRIRFLNAGSDTVFRVALGGHPMTVTHTDGFPVQPVETDALLLAMGERYDVTVNLGDGVFPLVALPEGKQGQALAVVRTGAGAVPPPGVRPAELNRRVLLGTALRSTPEVTLPDRKPDRTYDLGLSGNMASYVWTINGRTFGQHQPLTMRRGEAVRLRFLNQSMMFHPMHVHGHTFQVRGANGPGPRKDTVLVLPMQAVVADLVADNPGQWATHCHNIYHAERGMMTTLSYQA